MPHYTCEFLEIEPYLQARTNPEKCLRRSGNEVWQVRKEPIDFGQQEYPQDPLRWALVRSGDFVRIPLIPYRTSQQPHEFVMAVLDIAQRLVCDSKQATRIHWVVGKPIEDIRPEADAFRLWVGLAIQLH